MNILVLGTGNAQVDLIKLLSKRHTVHVLSNSKDGRGRQFAHFFQVIDIKNETAVTDYSKNNGIELIYSVGSDLAMVTSARVSNSLELPSFITPNIALICHNKSLLRKYLKGVTGNISHQTLSAPDDLNGFEFPCIIKPVDSQGQRGVFFVRDKKELIDNFRKALSFSESRAVIAEHYVDGPEVSVNIYLVEGEIRIFIITDRIVWPEYPGGIIQKHRFPSEFACKDNKAEIYDLVSEVVQKIGIKNGPVYFQIKLEGNKPKLIEVTPRLDGCHLWRLIDYATGINLLKITSNDLLNNELECIALASPKKTWVLEFMCAAPGTSLNRNEYDLGSTDHYEWYYNSGDVVKSINTYWEKCGYKIHSI